MSLVNISITCSGCEQQVSGFVQVRKSNRVAALLEEALAAAHMAACYVQEDPRHGQDQEVSASGSASSEGEPADEAGDAPASTVH